MRKEYRKELRQWFDEGLSKGSGFSPAKADPKWSVSGEMVWKKEYPGNLWGFIALVPHHKGAESFTIEALWSKRGRYPQLTARPCFARGDQAERQADEYCARIGALGGSPHGDKWYEIEPSPLTLAHTPEELLELLMKQRGPLSPEEARRRVASLARQALDDIGAFILPYLDLLAEERRPGCSGEVAMNAGAG